MPPPNRKYRKPARTGLDTSTWTAAERAEHRRQELLRTPVAEMGLSVRIVNTLEDNNVIVAADLVRQTYDSLMRMKNFGEKTLGEVRKAVVKLGLAAPEWAPPPKTAKPKPRKKPDWDWDA